MRFYNFVIFLALSIIVSACDGGGGTGALHPCEENIGVHITEPTYYIKYSVSKQPVTLQGITWASKYWYSCWPCVPEPNRVSVMVKNDETGYLVEANDTFELGILGYTHKWYDFVPLIPGENNLRATLYVDNSEDGYDCIAINYVPDYTPPSIPHNLIASSIIINQVKLSWETSIDNATTDDASVRYKIYRDGNPVAIAVTSNTFEVDEGLISNQNYCYTVSAIDTAENESPLSLPSCVDVL